MEIIKEINLNINQPNNFELINIMQGSIDSIKVVAHLYDGNVPYQIPDTVSEYQLLGILPSGKYLIDDQITKHNLTSVSFFINKNIMAKPGYVEFTISLVENGDKIIVETFPAKILVTAIPGQDYEQTDEIPIITKALQEIKRNAEEAEESANKAKESEINAYISAVSASDSASTAISKANDAKTSEANARLSEINAASSETSSASSASTASIKATEASNSAITASKKATEASTSASQSKDYADSSKSYYDQTKDIYDSFDGSLELWKQSEPEEDKQKLKDYWIKEV